MKPDDRDKIPNTLTCYKMHDQAPPLVPASSSRDWMDQTRNRFAYRCLPLTIANSAGWELLCPVTLSAEWNGGPDLQDITITSEDQALAERYAHSHFGGGVLTFSAHYLFRTEPGVALWARGSPNLPKDGIYPLDGIIETDWLNFTFTMNWIFTRPGKVTFKKNEPYCFLTPIRLSEVEALVPQILPLSSNEDLAAKFAEYSAARKDFNQKLNEFDPDASQAGWQKWYTRGVHPDGQPGGANHRSKLSLREPKEKF